MSISWQGENRKLGWNLLRTGALIMAGATRHEWYEGTNPYRDAAYSVFRRAASRRSYAFESGNAGRQGFGRRQCGTGQGHAVRPVCAERVADPRRRDAETDHAHGVHPPPRPPRIIATFRR